MTAVFSVVEPGLLTTVQDLGRPGAIASGVPPAGAMDRFAHAAANLLVGNDRNHATLECTMSGPSLLTLRSCLVAVTGADLGPQVNGRAAPMWTGIFMAAGDRLSFAGRRSGMRSYVAVSSGFDGERWLGSRSTYLLVSRGGMQGRALRAGDVLHVAADRSAPTVAGRQLAGAMLPDYADHTLAVIAGPHLKRLDVTSRKALFGETFKVSAQADRMGYRLDGPPLVMSGDELLSFGLAAGALQVTSSGQPIMLMADHQTAGGYAVVATVVSASLPVAAQLGPGDELRFKNVTEVQARSMRLELSGALASLASP